MPNPFGKNVSLPKVVIDKVIITSKGYPFRKDPHTGISEPQVTPDGAAVPDGYELFSKQNLETIFFEVKVLLKEEKVNGKYKIFDNELILKNLKIKILQVNLKSIHQTLVETNSPLDYDKVAETAPATSAHVEGQIIDVFSDLDDRKLKQKYIGKKGNSKKEFYIPYTFTFAIPGVENGYNPSFLSYFVYCSLDSEAIEEDLGLDKGALGSSLRGSLSAEIVYDEGKPRTTAYAYYRQDNGELFSTQDGLIYQAGGSAGPWVGDPGGPGGIVYPLVPLEIINTKIHNYRKINLLKNIDLEGDFDLDVIREKIIKKKYEQHAANKFEQANAGSYFSNLYLSEDSAEDVKMLFSLDWKGLLLSKSLFPRIFENTADYVLEEIISKSRIVSAKMTRKKIPLSAMSSLDLAKDNTAALQGNDNKINIHTQDNDHYENEDIFLEIQHTINPGTTKKYKRLYPENSEIIGRFTELTSATPKNLDGIRTFSLTDHTVKKYSEGKYQYGVEFEFVDGTVDWLRKKKNNLLGPLKLLREYYLSSTLTKFYMDEAGKFTEYFINFSEGRGAIDTILNCIETYCTILEALFNKTVDDEIINTLYSIAAPASGTPEGILIFLNLIESMHAKLHEIIGRISPTPPTPGEADSAVEGSSKTTFGSVGNTQKITYYFSELYEKEKHFGGYNFIFPTFNSGVSKKGTEILSYGLTKITLSAYKERINQEMEKYYTSGIASNESLNWSSYNLGFSGDPNNNINIDVSNRKYSYLTPSTVNLLGQEVNSLYLSKKIKGTLNGKLSSGDKATFSKILSDIMKFNLQKNVSLSKNSNIDIFHPDLNDTQKHSLTLRQELRNMLTDMSITIERGKGNFSLLNPEDNEDENQLRNIATHDESELLGISKDQRLADISEKTNANDLLMKILLSRLWMIGGTGMSWDFDSYGPKPLWHPGAGFIWNSRVDDIEDYDPESWVAPVAFYDEPEEILKDLPLQLLSLSLASPTQWEKGGHAWLKRKWSPETTEMTRDNFNFEFFAYFFLNYKKIVQIEYLDSYQKNDAGVTLLKSPIWKKIDGASITNLQLNQPGSEILCRIKDWNASASSPFKEKHHHLREKELKLKILNQFFIIKF